MPHVFLCDPVRTPIGRYGGALAKVRTDDLAAVPIRALVDRHPHIKNMVHEVYLGCANQAGEDNRNVARMAALLAGLPETVPGVTVNRLCGSSLDAVATAARAIKAGEASLVIAGGVTWVFALVMTLFEILVEFLQAYVFTLLSALYIGGALADDH